MSMSEILSLAQTVSVLLAILVAVSTLRGRGDTKAADLAEMRIDIKYIKESLDKMEDVRDRLTLVEASAKSAHKRIDEMQDGRS